MMINEKKCLHNFCARGGLILKGVFFMKKSAEKKTLLHRIVSASAAFIAAFAVCTMSMSGAAAAEETAFGLPEISVGGKYKVYAEAAEAIRPTEPQTETVGTQTYYLIGTREELLWFANRVNKDKQTNINAMLKCDVSFNDTSDYAEWTELNAPAHMWTAIGTKANPYRGIFDGAGFAISGIYISNDNESQGLFGYVADGTIKNLGITKSYIKGGTAVGGIVGTIETGRVKNCYNSGAVNGRYCGGVVGAVLDVCAVSDSYNLGNVVGTNYTGGVFGYITAGCQISNNYNAGNVRGVNYVGGIAGHAGTKDGALRISNCYSRGKLTATGDYIGGLFGATEAENSGASIKISNCYSYSEVTSAGGGIGGFVGCSINSGSILIEHSRYYIDKNADMFGAAEGTNPSSSDCARFSNTSSAKSDLASFLNDGGASRIGYRGWIIGEDGMPCFGDKSEYHVWEGGADVQPELVDGYYLIGSGEELAWFAELVNSGEVRINGKLTADIILNYTDSWEMWPNVKEPLNSWTPIGSETNPFRGTFDGDGHTVVGIYINSSEDYQGLFGYASNATIENIGVIQSYINGSRYVGSIVGRSFCSNIMGCYNSGFVCTEKTGSGGNYDAVGGIVGCPEYGKIINCYNSGSVYAGSTAASIHYAGGIVGYADSTGIIANCYNSGSVSSGSSGKREVGGIIGNLSIYTSYDDSTKVSNCYNTGNISEGTMAGSIVGYVYSVGTVTIDNCKYLAESNLPAVGSVCTADTKFKEPTVTDCGTFADTTALLQALNSKAKDNEDYKAWECKASENSGYPVFAASRDILAHYKYVQADIGSSEIESIKSKATVGVTSVKVNAVSGYEYSRDKINWSSSKSVSSASPETNYTFYVRRPETADKYASAYVEFSLKTKAKATQTITDSERDAIKAKVVYDYTSVAFAVPEVSGYEYSLDGKSWSSSLYQTGSDWQEFTVYVRKAGTSEKYASGYKTFTVTVNYVTDIGDLGIDTSIYDFANTYFGF